MRTDLEFEEYVKSLGDAGKKKAVQKRRSLLIGGTTVFCLFCVIAFIRFMPAFTMKDSVNSMPLNSSGAANNMPDDGLNVESNSLGTVEDGMTDKNVDSGSAGDVLLVSEEQFAELADWYQEVCINGETGHVQDFDGIDQYYTALPGENNLTEFPDEDNSGNYFVTYRIKCGGEYFDIHTGTFVLVRRGTSEWKIVDEKAYGLLLELMETF